MLLLTLADTPDSRSLLFFFCCLHMFVTVVGVWEFATGLQNLGGAESCARASY